MKKKLLHSVKIISLLPAIYLSLLTVNAHATTASATFNIVVNVTSPTCTVSTNNSAITLPTATSPSQTATNYVSSNNITLPGLGGGGISWITSATLNQTATITCAVASTPITSFLVAPATSAAVLAGYLSLATPVDTAGKLWGLTYLSYEQVSVNGSAAPQWYGSTATAGQTTNPYTTVFSTAAVANGTATVIWRPSFAVLTPNAPVGSPAGGSFSSPGQIVVNY